jgi:hypothetical protein
MRKITKKYLLLGSRHITSNKKADDLSNFLEDGFLINSKLYKSCINILNKLTN